MVNLVTKIVTIYVGLHVQSGLLVDFNQNCKIFTRFSKKNPDMIFHTNSFSMRWYEVEDKLA